MSAPMLPAETPRAWLDTHLDARLREHEEPGTDESRRTWVTRAEVLDDDAALLRATRTRVMADDGAPAVAAAKWVVDWYAGRLALAVGFVYAGAEAAVLVDPDQVRFGLHPDGWVQLVDLGDPEFVVLPGHAWAGRPGVRTAEDEDELVELMLGSLRDAVEPVVAAGRRLAKVGANALWAEVADSFGLVLLHQTALPVRESVLARVQRALHSPVAPWRKRPDVFVTDHRGEPTYVGRKGGCCLAYQCEPVAADPEVPTGPPEPDPQHLAWQERFPPVAGEHEYCTTCSLRDVEGCVERQLYWRDLQRAGPS